MWTGTLSIIISRHQCESFGRLKEEGILQAGKPHQGASGKEIDKGIRRTGAFQPDEAFDSNGRHQWLEQWLEKAETSEETSNNGPSCAHSSLIKTL